jgi:hypothetical protein
MIREFSSFILVDRMANVGIRALNAHFASLGLQCTGRFST